MLVPATDVLQRPPSALKELVVSQINRLHLSWRVFIEQYTEQSQLLTVRFLHEEIDLHDKLYLTMVYI